MRGGEKRLHDHLNELAAALAPKVKMVVREVVAIHEIHQGDVSVLMKLGEGSFGDVFKGTWRGQPVAKKQLKNLNHQEFLKLKREGALLMRVLHPNIVTLFGMCTNPAVPFLVFEFADKGTLYAWLHGSMGAEAESLSDDLKVLLLCNVAHGVAFMHDRLICHRDIKRLL
jgi:serine/threonine protein kinase